MKNSRFLWLPWVVTVALLLALPAWAQDEGMVEAIKIVGNKRVHESNIRYYIKTQVGEPLSRPQVRKDIEQIYKMGHFKNIQVDTHPLGDGLEVVFTLEEIPSIGDIRILGNKKIETEDIREKISLKEGATFQDHLLLASVEEIKSLYQEKGYFFAEVKVDTDTTPENLVDIGIRVREGEKVSVEKISFSGNKKFTDKELRKVIETTEDTWYSFLTDDGIYQKDVLKLDRFRVEAFYQDNGYYRVRVLEPKIDVNKQEKAIYITIPVEEGPLYRVASVTVKGDELLTSEELMTAVHLKKDDTFNVSALREDSLAIGELYSEKGYAYADVNPLTQINDETKTVDLTIEVDKGRKVYVGKIEIQGNVDTRDNVIRREFRLKEGELFDSKKLKRSKQRINNLQFFEDVKIDTRRGEERDLIDVVTTVTERPTGSLSVGAGFSSVENFIFTGSISQNNLFGRGQRLAFTTSLSSIRTDFNLSFTDPRVFDTEVLLGIDAFNRDSDFISFDSRSRGTGVRLGKSITEYDWVGLAYRFEDVEVSNVAPEDVTEFLKNENRITSRVTPSYVRDTRDDFLNPSKGWRHVVRFEIAGGVLGGSDFYRSGYEGTYYHPLIGKLVGAVHAEINYAEGYGGEELPAFERYFMGGANSLRGYTIEEVGPMNASGDPLGGTQSLLFNVELQYPFSKSFRGFLFYDRGNVYGEGADLSRTAENYDLAEMRHSVGAGIRFLSPFGPIGFAYGVKLDKAPGDSAGEFHFSAGGAF